MTNKLRVSLVGFGAAVAFVVVDCRSAPARSSITTASTRSRRRDSMLANSQVMEVMSYLTDVYGPRLTGSPNVKKAGDWAVAR
jgi:hypothetical protein